MNNYEVLPLFSKPLYKGQIKNIDYEKHIDIIKDYEWIISGEKESDNLSYVSNDRYVLENKKFKKLKQAILNEFNIYKSDVLKYKNDFKITTSWLTFTDNQRYSKLHNHTNCMFSGILYLSTNENDGDLYIEDVSNKRFYLIPEEYNIYNSQSQNIKPKVGQILFFPSDLYHQIEINKTNSNRISLAFNIIPTGDLGKGDSHLNI